MAAVVVIFRASHDELPKISKTFRSESTHVKSSIDRLNRVVQVLEGGDWVGEGATAFYNEMRSEVMPALLRLMQALEMGATVTQQINQVIEEVEQETVHFFAIILGTFEGGGAGAVGSLGGQAGGAGGGGSESASTSEGKTSGGGGGGSGAGGGGGGAGGSGGGGSWDGEIGFRQEKPPPVSQKKPGRRRSAS